MCQGQITLKNWQNLPIGNPKPDLNNINAHTMFGENPFIFTQVIIQKQKYDGTDRHTDSQYETIIPRHYRVMRYKNMTLPFNSLRKLSRNKLMNMIINYFCSSSHIWPGVEISYSFMCLKRRNCSAMTIIWYGLIKGSNQSWKKICLHDSE